MAVPTARRLDTPEALATSLFDAQLYALDVPLEWHDPHDDSITVRYVAVGRRSIYSCTTSGNLANARVLGVRPDGDHDRAIEQLGYVVIEAIRDHINPNA
jgi:hypothetical protein